MHLCYGWADRPEGFTLLRRGRRLFGPSRNRRTLRIAGVATQSSIAEALVVCVPSALRGLEAARAARRTATSAIAAQSLPPSPWAIASTKLSRSTLAKG